MAVQEILIFGSLGDGLQEGMHHAVTRQGLNLREAEERYLRLFDEAKAVVWIYFEGFSSQLLENLLCFQIGKLQGGHPPTVFFVWVLHNV